MEEILNRYYVYGLVDPITEEVLYIGKGCGSRSRCFTRTHLVGSWLDELREKKLKPIVIYFYENVTEDIAYKKEELLISLYGRKIYNTGFLLNIAGGGRYRKSRESTHHWLGRVHKEESIEKCRQKATGKIHSEETKNKMSLKKKGKSNHRDTQVIIYGILYNSVKEASKAINLSYANLSSKISSGEYSWCYYANEKDRMRILKRKNRKPEYIKNDLAYLNIEETNPLILKSFHKYFEH